MLLTGEQEASMELDAARAIWGKHFGTYFPTAAAAATAADAGGSSSSGGGGGGGGGGAAAADASLKLGLFSAGGQSMQVGQPGMRSLSFNLSIYAPELEEPKGADKDDSAWRPVDGIEPEAWRQWEARLLEQIASEKAQLEATGEVPLVSAARLEHSARAANAMCPVLQPPEDNTLCFRGHETRCLVHALIGSRW